MFDEVGGMTTLAKGSQGGQGRRASSTPAAARRPLLFLNDIRDRAYKKWVAVGMPQGDGARFWLEAEQEMREGR